MLISHKYKFIYTKTVKTGGTSVESYFEPFCMPDEEWKFSHQRNEYVSEYGIIGHRGQPGNYTWYNHMSAQKIREKIGQSVWNNYFKFCVVRNPFEKLVSEFYFERNRSNLDFPGQVKKRIKRMLGKPGVLDDINHSDEIEAFRIWITRGGGNVDRDKYLIDGQVCIDYFIKHEELSNGVKNVCQALDIPFEPERIPNLKSGIRKNKMSLQELYDAKTIDIVSKKFQFELNYFNYKFPV